MVVTQAIFSDLDLTAPIVDNTPILNISMIRIDMMIIDIIMEVLLPVESASNLLAFNFGRIKKQTCRTSIPELIILMVSNMIIGIDNLEWVTPKENAERKVFLNPACVSSRQKH
ncbi:hypothetical protein Glove_319g169 [Diversispora epigaea]|uniref:Uncharacterized protein n=1 Tax=Diversispora epigaea TaxID=1348612 RepID=A0A397HWQ2_9GLOM|nr:hypothetical protein Glove_319g169 [Diversispora epigaea]